MESENKSDMNFCTVDLGGGIGNVLFKIACGYTYSNKFGRNFILDEKFMDRNINYHYSFGVYSEMLKNFKIDNDYREWISFSEGDFCWSEIPNIEGNVKLNGLFQSHKYINRNEFIGMLKIENFDECSDFTSIHVRHGDYYNHPDIFDRNDINYYTKAIEIMDGDDFLVFSDDIGKCKEMFRGFPNIEYVEEINPQKTLCMMASCRRHIITNSTFGWWGAYLSNSQTVISPSRWFLPSFFSTISKKSKDQFLKDIYPENWTII